jgi:hypothetical protein
MSRLPSARSKQKALAKALAKSPGQKEGPAPGARRFKKSPKRPQLETPQIPALAEQRQGLIRARWPEPALRPAIA